MSTTTLHRHPQRTLWQDLGPNEVAIYCSPGPRGRRVVGTFYDVEALVRGEWQIIRRFENGRDASLFATGFMEGARNEQLAPR